MTQAEGHKSGVKTKPEDSHWAGVCLFLEKQLQGYYKMGEQEAKIQFTYSKMGHRLRGRQSKKARKKPVSLLLKLLLLHTRNRKNVRALMESKGAKGFCVRSTQRCSGPRASKGLQAGLPRRPRSCAGCDA